MALTDKLTAIADGFRAARNITDKLTLDQMAQLAAESGVSDDVRYVTFMNGDEVVYVKPVAVGDDCVDVVAKGIISAPTKESTAQYNFTFAGWDTYNANHVDGGALKAVTENRTVYACYTEIVRKYAANFYDENGTLLKTMQEEYGSKAVAPDVSREGYNFEGWTPSDLTIYKDTDFVGSWEKITGFGFVTTVPTGAGSDMAISPNGNLVMRVNQGSVTTPMVYDISSGTPTELTYPPTTAATLSNLQYCDFSYDGEFAVVGASANNANYTGSHWWNTADGTYVSNLKSANNRIVCANNHSWVAYLSGSASTYTINISDLYTKSSVITTAVTTIRTVSRMAFSPDDQYIAMCGAFSATDSVQILKVSDGTLVKILNVSKAVNVSWSAGGTRLAVTLSASPWVEIYDTATWSKICDLGEYFSAKSYAEFIAETSVLVVGCGTTVKAFELVESTLKELPDIPEYNGDTINQIRTNKNGSRILIGGTSNIDVWRFA